MATVLGPSIDFAERELQKPSKTWEAPNGEEGHDIERLSRAISTVFRSSVLQAQFQNVSILPLGEHPIALPSPSSPFELVQLSKQLEQRAHSIQVSSAGCPSKLRAAFRLSI